MGKKERLKNYIQGGCGLVEEHLPSMWEAPWVKSPALQSQNRTKAKNDDIQEGRRHPAL
jgi:hypothetical protein